VLLTMLFWHSKPAVTVSPPVQSCTLDPAVRG
jgi:hypothetical protein